MSLRYGFSPPRGGFFSGAPSSRNSLGANPLPNLSRACEAQGHRREVRFEESVDQTRPDEGKPDLRSTRTDKPAGGREVHNNQGPGRCRSASARFPGGARAAIQRPGPHQISAARTIKFTAAGIPGSRHALLRREIALHLRPAAQDVVSVVESA